MEWGGGGPSRSSSEKVWGGFEGHTWGINVLDGRKESNKRGWRYKVQWEREDSVEGRERREGRIQVQ